MPNKTSKRWYASVRFVGVHLDPVSITKAIRLPPDIHYRYGEPKVSRSKKGVVLDYGDYSTGLWCMSSENWVSSPRPEEHLHWILQQLEPFREYILSLQINGIRGDLFCYSLGTTDLPPGIPRTIRARADALGLNIQQDHYMANE
jgi:hypothetical protein